LSVAYEKPLHIVRGSMQYLFDADGRRYLDAYNNVAHVGHCHRKVVAAGQRQMELLNTNTRYLSELILEYAEKLTATLPEPLKVCYFVNSGSEANELAIRLARAHTKARDMIVLDHAYHGNTSTLIDLSPYKHNGPGGQGAPSWVHTAALPTSEWDATEVANLVAKIGPHLCGFIAESLPSVAGQIVLPQKYLGRVYAAVRGAGGVCIADEVQTGYGRIGSHFYGFEKYGVLPDIVVLGKPIGNGHPIGAVITTRAIAESFDNGMEFFSTFGGNNVSCAIGIAVLEVVQEENLQQHALQVGERLLEGLRALQQRHSLIGDVRGSGLHLGVELVCDNDPATQEANRIVNLMRDHGILIGTDGPHHNVLKIRPPMPFADRDADQLLTTLDKSFKASIL
jgi:4-aminobutyrate aminotransferase-like enzyme